MSTVKVKGLAELNRFLQELPVKMERTVLRSALGAGAGVIRKAARENIHRVSGDLARSLRVSTGSKSGTVTARVVTNVFYGRFVEYGTRPHYIPGPLVLNGKVLSGVNHPGIPSPRPFLRPALDNNAGAAVLAVAARIKERLTRQGLSAAEAIDVAIEELAP